VLDLLMAYMAFEAGMTINVWDGMFGASAGTPLTGPLPPPTPVPVPASSVFVGRGNLLLGSSEIGQRWRARWCVHSFFGLRANRPHPEYAKHVAFVRTK